MTRKKKRPPATGTQAAVTHDDAVAKVALQPGSRRAKKSIGHDFPLFRGSRAAAGIFEQKDGRMTNEQRERYDTDMLRGFIDHLLWELRASHLETYAPGKDGGKVNDELVEQLAKYHSKYGAALLPLIIVDKATTEMQAQSWKHELREERQKQIDALELLDTLFKEAFWAIDHCYSKGSMPAIQRKPPL